MVERSADRVALFSIKPRYARAILDGTKRVELRRVCPEGLSHVVIYASSPDQQVVGWFEVRRVERGSPTSIWNRHRKVAGLSRSDFRAYFLGASEASAVLIRRVVVLDTPMDLTEVVADGVAPQSFRYLDDCEASVVIPNLRSTVRV
jgi:predicted transcriptional regulator